MIKSIQITSRTKTNDVGLKREENGNFTIRLILKYS